MVAKYSVAQMTDLQLWRALREQIAWLRQEDWNFQVDRAGRRRRYDLIWEVVCELQKRGTQLSLLPPP